MIHGSKRKHFPSYIWIGATFGVIVLYFFTNISKRKQLTDYQLRLDSTTLLLDKISNIQSQNQIKILKISNALFDTISTVSFDTSKDTSSSITKRALPIRQTKSFWGTTNSEKVNFGINDYCIFSVQLKDIQFSVQLNNQLDSINQVFLQSYAVEKIVKCEENFEPTKPHQQLYNLKTFKISGDNLNISFTPSDGNQPKCNVLFSGRIDNNKINGTLTWQRYDMDDMTGYNYKIIVPIILN